MRNQLFCLLLMLTVVSCADDDPTPKTTEYFKLKTYEMNPLGEGAQRIANWVMLHDKDGKLIAAREFAFGDSLVFDTVNAAKPSDFQVSLGIVYSYNGKRFANFETFPEKAGAYWKMAAPQTTQPPNYTYLGPGTIKITGEDISDVWQTSISGELNYQQVPAFDGTTYRFDFNSFDEINDYLISAYDDTGEPKYLFLKDLLPGNYTYDYSEFKTFDVVKEYSFPTTASILCFNSGYTDANQNVYQNSGYYTSFMLNSFMTNPPLTNKIKVGFLNEFAKYRMSLSLSYIRYSYSYSHAGSIPESLSFPESLSISSASETFKDFTFSANGNYVYSQTYWNTPITENTFSWLLFSEPNGAKNPSELPATLLAQMPGFDISALTRTGTTLYTTSNSLADVIGERFKGKAKPAEYTTIAKYLQR